jgi:hypothetical protein
VKVKPQCKARVWTDYGYGNCRNKASIDGYCRIHNPAIRAQKAAAKNAKWKADFDAAQKKSDDAERAQKELERDAARYRWLREVEPKVDQVSAHRRVYDGYHFHVGGQELDAAIDAAMVKP